MSGNGQKNYGTTGQSNMNGGRDSEQSHNS